MEIAWALVDVPSKSMLESQSQLVRPQRELPEDFLKTWTGHRRLLALQLWACTVYSSLPVYSSHTSNCETFV